MALLGVLRFLPHSPLYRATWHSHGSGADFPWSEWSKAKEEERKPGAFNDLVSEASHSHFYSYLLEFDQLNSTYIQDQLHLLKGEREKDLSKTNIDSLASACYRDCATWSLPSQQVFGAGNKVLIEV